MYFRLPVLIVFVFAGIIALMAFQSRFSKQVSLANGEELIVPAESGLLSSETTDKDGKRNKGLRSIRAVDLRAHLEFLADDLLEGRESGSRGARLAAMYIATHFERLGLRAVGDDQTYYQAVSLARKRVLPGSELKVEIKGEMVPLRFGQDFLVAATPSESGTPIRAPLVFCGFGIKSEQDNYDDYKNINVEDKVALYLSGEPHREDENGSDAGAPPHYVSGRTKRRIARQAGAVAAIGVLRQKQLAQFGWAGMQTHLLSARVSLMADKAHGEPGLASVILHPQAASIIFADEQQDYAAVDEAASSGLTHAFEMNKRVEIKILFEDEEIHDSNVVAFLEGSDPELKSEVIVVSAHYDHVGMGTAVAGDSVYNGAADNASGTAGLLELAEAFASLTQSPRRSLLFLAVTAEEKGLLGSKYYVEHPIFPLEKTVANFNLDMIGIGDTTALVVYGIDRSSLGDDVRKAAARFGLEIWPDDMPEQRIFYRSDHYSFAQKGVPAIFPSFGTRRSDFPEFKKFYHRPSDDVTLSWLNYPYMQKHVQVVFQAMLEVANADEPPQWVPDDEFGKVRQRKN
ncbi:MAG: M20/M25/M40 family metallo-hydrolase [bacterium]